MNRLSWLSRTCGAKVQCTEQATQLVQQFIPSRSRVSMNLGDWELSLQRNGLEGATEVGCSSLDVASTRVSTASLPQRSAITEDEDAEGYEIFEIAAPTVEDGEEAEVVPDENVPLEKKPIVAPMAVVKSETETAESKAEGVSEKKSSGVSPEGREDLPKENKGRKRRAVSSVFKAISTVSLSFTTGGDEKTEPVTGDGVSPNKVMGDAVSSPPRADAVSSPPRADGVSSPPRADGVSSPPRADGVSSPPRADGVSSPPRGDGVSSPTGGGERGSEGESIGSGASRLGAVPQESMTRWRLMETPSPSPESPSPSVETAEGPCGVVPPLMLPPAESPSPATVMKKCSMEVQPPQSPLLNPTVSIESSHEAFSGMSSPPATETRPSSASPLASPSRTREGASTSRGPFSLGAVETERERCVTWLRVETGDATPPRTLQELQAAAPGVRFRSLTSLLCVEGSSVRVTQAFRRDEVLAVVNPQVLCAGVSEACALAMCTNTIKLAGSQGFPEWSDSRVSFIDRVSLTVCRHAGSRRIVRGVYPYAYFLFNATPTQQPNVRCVLHCNQLVLVALQGLPPHAPLVAHPPAEAAAVRPTHLLLGGSAFPLETRILYGSRSDVNHMSLHAETARSHLWSPEQSKSPIKQVYPSFASPKRATQRTPPSPDKRGTPTKDETPSRTQPAAGEGFKRRSWKRDSPFTTPERAKNHNYLDEWKRSAPAYFVGRKGDKTQSSKGDTPKETQSSKGDTPKETQPSKSDTAKEAKGTENLSPRSQSKSTAQDLQTTSPTQSPTHDVHSLKASVQPSTHSLQSPDQCSKQAPGLDSPSLSAAHGVPSSKSSAESVTYDSPSSKSSESPPNLQSPPPSSKQGLQSGSSPASSVRVAHSPKSSAQSSQPDTETPAATPTHDLLSSESLDQPSTQDLPSSGNSTQSPTADIHPCEAPAETDLPSSKTPTPLATRDVPSEIPVRAATHFGQSPDKLATHDLESRIPMMPRATCQSKEDVCSSEETRADTKLTETGDAKTKPSDLEPVLGGPAPDRVSPRVEPPREAKIHSTAEEEFFECEVSQRNTDLPLKTSEVPLSNKTELEPISTDSTEPPREDVCSDSEILAPAECGVPAVESAAPGEHSSPLEVVAASE